MIRKTSSGSTARSEKTHSDYVLVKEAYRSYRRKKYRDAIVLLEKVIDSGIRHPYPYVLIALAYLLADQFQKADSMLKRIRMIDPEYRPYIHLELFLALKSSAHHESVLVRYVDALNRFPDDKQIMKSLKIIRDVDDFLRLQKEARLSDFMRIPKPLRHDFIDGAPWEASYLWIAIPVGIIFLVLLAIMLYRYGLPRAHFFTSVRKTAGVNIDQIHLGPARYDLFEKMSRQRTKVFYYSNESIENDFSRAKKLIKREKYNSALLLLNKLNNSNVNMMVKERVDFLIKFVMDVEEREFESRPYKEIAQDPPLYQGVAVQWRGRVANLRRKGDSVLFDLLVDYRERDIFSGVSDVYAEGDWSIANGDVVDVKAILTHVIGSDKRLYLVAKEIVRSSTDEGD